MMSNSSQQQEQQQPKSNSMPNIGAFLRMLRKEQDLSQEKIAKKLGLSIPAYSKIESGITDINLSRLFQLSEIFEMDAIELLSRSKYGNNFLSVETVFKDQVELHKQIIAEKDAEIYSLQKKLINYHEKD